MRSFTALDAAQAYIDVRTRRSRWFAKRWPEIARTGVVVKPVYTRQSDFEKVQARRNGSQQAFFPIIYLPTGAGTLFDAEKNNWNELLLWHLVAHCCANSSTHSRDWARTWLTLTRKYMGVGAARVLRELYSKHKIHYLTRKLNDAQREAARRRFIKNVYKHEENA